MNVKRIIADVANIIKPVKMATKDIRELGESAKQSKGELKKAEEKRKLIASYQSAEKNINKNADKYLKAFDDLDTKRAERNNAQGGNNKTLDKEIKALEKTVRDYDRAAAKQLDAQKKLKSAGVNIKKVPEERDRLDRKSRDLRTKIKKDKAVSRQTKRDQGIARANSRIASSANIGKLKGELLGFVTGAIGKAASKLGENSPAGRAIKKWNEATSAFYVAIGSALVPALEPLTNLVKNLAQKLTKFSQENPKIIKAIGVLIAVFIVLMSVVAPVLAALGTLSYVFGAVASVISVVTGVFTTVFSVISTIVGAIAASTLSLLAIGGIIVLVIAAIAAALYFFSDEIKAIFFGIVDFIKSIFSSIIDYIAGLFSGDSWLSSLFGDSEEKEKVEEIQNQSSRVERAVPAATEIDVIKSKTESSSIKGLALATAVAAGGGAATENNTVLEQQKIVEGAKGSNTTLVTTSENYFETDKLVKKVEDTKPSVDSLGVNSSEQFVSQNFNQSDIQNLLPSNVNQANKFIQDNTIVAVADNTQHSSNSASSDVINAGTQITSANRLTSSDNKQVHVEGDKIEINISGLLESNGRELALAIRKELEKHQAEKARQLRGMLND